MFTEKEFVLEVVRLIRENPDFIYVPSLGDVCKYTSGGNCVGCLFGQALNNLGFPIEALRALDQGSVSIREIGRRLKFNEHVCLWAGSIQHRQDNNVAWGEALELTEKVHTKTKEKYYD